MILSLKQDVHFGLSCSLNKAFCLQWLWPLTDPPQIGVFETTMIVKLVSCRNNITGLKDTHETEDSTPHIIIKPKKLFKKMWKIII